MYTLFLFLSIKRLHQLRLTLPKSELKVYKSVTIDSAIYEDQMLARVTQKSVWPFWFTAGVYASLLLLQGAKPELLQIYQEIEIALTMA